MELTRIQQAAKQTIDEKGNRVIQIPLDLWDEFLAEQAGGQIGRLTALFEAWEAEPQDDMPNGWWDEFMTFLAENRFNLGDDENE